MIAFQLGLGFGCGVLTGRRVAAWQAGAKREAARAEGSDQEVDRQISVRWAKVRLGDVVELAVELAKYFNTLP